MNTYDFDGTIYHGDSTVDFFLFALKTKPAILRYFPCQLAGALRYGLGLADKTFLKEKFFSFFPAIDASDLVEVFWAAKHGNIYPWYPPHHKNDDIILSASPEFLLRPICKRLGVQHLIASRVDPSTGKFEGVNCRGSEKVKRLKEEYGVLHVDEFFSDSKADSPMAAIADHAFLIRGGKPVDWPWPRA